MSKYRIIVNDVCVAEDIHALSPSGAVDRYFDFKRGRVSKDSMRAVEQEG